MAKQKLPPTLLELQPHQSTNISIQLLFTQAGATVALRFPPVVIPPGASVTLIGNNGTKANTDVAYAARYPDNLNASAGTLIPASLSPQDAVSFPVENLGEIWVTGSQGDGVNARIVGSPVS